MNSRNLLLVLVEISPDGDDRPRKALNVGNDRVRSDGHDLDSAALAARDDILREFTLDYLRRAHEMWLPAGWLLVRALDSATSLMAEVLGTPMNGSAGQGYERPRERHEVRQAMRAALTWHFSMAKDDSAGIRQRVERAMVAHAVSPHSPI